VVRPRAWAGLAVAVAASFVVTLDAMVLYVAFSIRRDFPEVSAAALSWILSGYTILIAAGMVGAGRWAYRLGRRRVFLGGIGLFSYEAARVLAPAVVVPGAGHIIRITHPQAVIDAVRSDATAGRQKRGAYA
jgi:MFS family permease